MSIFSGPLSVCKADVTLHCDIVEVKVIYCPTACAKIIAVWWAGPDLTSNGVKSYTLLPVSKRKNEITCISSGHFNLRF